MLILQFTAWVALAGCSDSNSVCDANEGRGCDECFDGVVTCSFDGVEVTEPSCGGCQAQAALYDELCAAGSDATVEEVDEGRVCEEVDDTGV